MTNDLQVQANKSIQNSSSDQQKSNHEPSAHIVPNGQDHQMKGYVHEHDQATVPVYAPTPLAIQHQMFHINGSHIPIGMYEAHTAHYTMGVEPPIMLSPQQAAPIDFNNSSQPWQSYPAYSTNIDFANGIYQTGPIASGPYQPQYLAYYPSMPITAQPDPNIANGADSHTLMAHLQQQPPQSQQQAQASSIPPPQGSYTRHTNGKSKTDYSSTKPFRANTASNKYPNQQTLSSFTNQNQFSNGGSNNNERGLNHNAKNHDSPFRPPRQQRPSKTNQQLNTHNKTMKPEIPAPQPQIDLNSNDFPVVNANPLVTENLAEASKPTNPGGRSYSSVVSTNLSESSVTNNDGNINSNAVATTMKIPEPQPPQQSDSQLNSSNANDQTEQTETTYEKAERSMLGRGSASKAKQKFIKNANYNYRPQQTNQKFAPLTETNGYYVTSNSPSQIVSFQTPYYPPTPNYVCSYNNNVPSQPFTPYADELVGYVPYQSNEFQPNTLLSFNFDLKDQLVVSRLKESFFFIIKSYSKDNVLHSIRHGIWCSTSHGNSILNSAFDHYYQVNQADVKAIGGVYLLFSVNASGQFCGVAKLLSRLDDSEQAKSQWAHSKWEGTFNIEWLMIKNVPNSCFRKITLENNEGKPVTNSRDAQEVPGEKAIEVFAIMQNYSSTSSILNQPDYPYEPPMSLATDNTPPPSMAASSYAVTYNNLAPMNANHTHYPKMNTSPRNHFNKNHSPGWNLKGYSNEFYGGLTTPSTEYQPRHAQGRFKSKSFRCYDDHSQESQQGFGKNYTTKYKLNNGETNESNLKRTIKKKEQEAVEQAMDNLKVADEPCPILSPENSSASSTTVSLTTHTTPNTTANDTEAKQVDN